MCSKICICCGEAICRKCRSNPNVCLGCHELFFDRKPANSKDELFLAKPITVLPMIQVYPNGIGASSLSQTQRIPLGFQVPHIVLVR